MTRSRWQRIAELLIRRHGKEFDAAYRDDMLATLDARANRARRRGRVAFVAFAIREVLALSFAAVRHQIRPDWQPQVRRAERRLSIDHLARELRHGARRLRRAPGFTVAVVITLGLAIAANTTVFTLLSRVVLTPLPYPSSDRLIALDHAAPALGIADGMGMSIGLYREYGALPSIEEIALYTEREGTLTGDGDAMRVDFLQATPSIGGLTGAQTQIGRWFIDAEGKAGAPNVVVITEALWRRRYGGSAAVLGKTLRVDGTPYQIVGVLSGRSVFPDQHVQFVMPLPLPRTWTRGAGFNYDGLARLAPDTTIDRVRREQNAVIADLPRRFESDRELPGIVTGGLRSLAQPLKDAVVGDTSMTLWALLGAAGLILAMAGANLANLFLVRHESKVPDLALRRALGATQVDLVAQVTTETLLATTAAGLLGFGLATLAVDLIATLGEPYLPRVHELRVDGAAMIFTIAITAATAVLLAVLPLSHLWLRQPSPLIDPQRTATTSAAGMRSRHLLLATQVALAVVLLSVAGLMTQSFRHLLRVDPGFQSDSRLTFTLNLPRSEFSNRADAAIFHSGLIDRLRTIPGVNDAGLISTLPLSGVGLGDPLEVRGRLALSADTTPMVRFRRASNQYFATMRIPLRAGRWFDDADAEGRTDSVLVDATLARLYFGDQDPLGKQIRPVEGDPQNRWLTIVGVVGNTATESLSESAHHAKMYVPLRGSMWADVPAPQDASYVLHVNGDPMGYVDSVRAMVTRAHAGVALAAPERLSDVIARARSSRTLTLILLVAAGAVATGIGLVGVYAVASYAVARRRTEIGVRIAIGATPRQVTTMMVGRSTSVILAGISAGLAGALVVARLFRSLLFGVAPGDWSTHLGVAMAVLALGVLACWLPAWHATKLNPARALRSD